MSQDLTTFEEIITFEKTTEERLDELKDILCMRGVNVPASQVMNEWKFYIQEILEPCGWQAIWKLSRMTCEKLCISFPTYMYVEVLSTDFNILCATLKILAVQDHVNLPEQIQVPLQHLYPTKVQSNNVLDIEGTANCIDQLRFFYNHVWQPWDIDDDETMDWPSTHLESRVQLYHDIQSGLVFQETGEYIRALLQEGKNVQNQIALLEEPINEDEEVADDVTLKLMKLNIRKENIKNELQILENPVMRNVLVCKNQRRALSRRQRSRSNEHSKEEVSFVWLGGTIDEFIKSLQEAKHHVGSDTFMSSSSCLGEALDQTITGDTIILCGGMHRLRACSLLGEGVLVKGLSSPEQTTVTAYEAGNILFECSACTIVFENMIIESHLVQTALLIRNGTVCMKNCHIVGRDRSCQGIIVLAGAKLEAEDCQFIGLEVGVNVNNGGMATLMSCKISKCNVGLQLFDNSSLSLKMCSLSECGESGIRIESFLHQSQSTCKEIVGSTALLEGNLKIKMEKTLLSKNLNGDVTLVKRNTGMFLDSADTDCCNPNINQLL